MFNLQEVYKQMNNWNEQNIIFFKIYLSLYHYTITIYDHLNHKILIGITKCLY